MRSPVLRHTLNRALLYAKAYNQRYLTPELLLLALTEDRDALDVLDQCDVDVPRLRENLSHHIQNAMFSERESHAIYYLQEQEMSRLDAVNYISHGIAKVPRATRTAAPSRAPTRMPSRRRWCARGARRSTPIASI